MRALKRSLALLAGLLIGFVAVGWWTNAPSRPSAAPEVLLARALPSPPVEAPAQEGATPAPAPEIDPWKELRLEGPDAFSPEIVPYVYYFGWPVSGGYIPSEDVEALMRNPEFADLYRKTMRLEADHAFWALGYFLGLSGPQYEALLDLAVEDNLERVMRINHSENKAEREEAVRQRMMTVAAKLDAMLDPRQRELFPLFKIGVGNSTYSMAVQAMVDAGEPPLTADQIRASLDLRTEVNENNNRNYRRVSYVPNPALTDLTPGQRRLLGKQRRLHDLNMLLSGVQSAKVRDPELSDLWPF